MFNYVAIDFALADNPPQRITSFTVTQERYAHEIIDIQFRDWDVQYSQVKPGHPVKCTLRGEISDRVFYGYVHDINPQISPGKRFVNVKIIGASFQMKQSRQRVYHDTTATEVVRRIAKSHNFSYEVDEHPRVYPQITQAGITDLQLLSRLAKQCGYTFRIENTAIHFKKLTTDFNAFKDSAPNFIMRNANDPQGSTLYSFNLILSESYKYTDGYKSAVQFGGVDAYTGVASIATNIKRPTTTRVTAETELFDSFATSTVSPNQTVAFYEAAAADERNRFPYRARIQVLGTPNLNPDKPVFLSGIGDVYSGYWMVLSSQHKVIETSPNVFQYTTYLEVGTDSLGAIRKFNAPDLSSPKGIKYRKITPNKRNIPVKHNTVLSKGTGTYKNTNLTQITNRAPISTDAKGVPHSYVADKGKNTNSDTDVKNRTATVITRLRGKGIPI